MPKAPIAVKGDNRDHPIELGGLYDFSLSQKANIFLQKIENIMCLQTFITSMFLQTVATIMKLYVFYQT